MVFTRSLARTIVEESSVVEMIESERVNYSRLEELFEGLKWRLARDAENGVRFASSNGVDYLLIKTPNWAINGVPVITALYSYDDDQVVIYSIKITP